jgi:CheY-like chemotaxis protein
MMPGMDGFELLRNVRENERIADTPFIFLSARAGEEAGAAGLDLGANDYLTKPFSAEDLRARASAQIAAFRRYEGSLQRQVIGRWFDATGNRSDAVFRMFADELPVMVFELDPSGALRFTNKLWHRVLNLPASPESHTLEAWKGVIHPDDLEGSLGVVAAGIEEREPWDLFYRLKPAGAGNERYQWYAARGIPRYTGGEFDGWIGYIAPADGPPATSR